MDFAKRAHDHNYRMDPIIRSRIDYDFYKLTMGQVISLKRPKTRVAFELDNRSKGIRLADHIRIEELREQLDHAQTLRYQKRDLINIQGQTFYGQEGMFKPPFIHSLALSRLPDYEVGVDEEAGQFTFRTEGDWLDVKDWETYSMSIVNELYVRSQLRLLPKSQLDIMYARAKVALYAKLERILERPEMTISEFGTRRRHSFLWQRWVVETMKEVLGKQFVGTSNVFLADELDVEAKGTVAHEMSMVYAALAAADGDEAIRQSQYQVLKDWQDVYGDNIRVFLPDTFGTTQFLRDAPSWIQWWTGYRPDSKEPIEAGEEAIAFWRRMGQDPAKKLCLFADGLDVETPGRPANGHDMIAIHDHFKGRIVDTYGWGTNATNDFRGCVPGKPEMMKPLSIVCKATSANGYPTVKLSDNPAKAKSNDPAEIARYMRIFGADGIDAATETLV